MKIPASPPTLFRRFFRWFCRPGLHHHIEGDLVELYHERLSGSGKWNADWKFACDVLLLFRPGIIRPMKNYKHLNNFGMFKNNLKVAWRNLLKSKAYSSINIVGLATGMAVASLIGLWVWDELSFDDYFQNNDRLAQVMLIQSDKEHTGIGSTVAMPLGDALRSKYSEDFKAVSLISWNNDHVLAVGDTKIMAGGMWVQREFPEMFTLTMLQGRRDVLKDPSTVLLAKSAAISLFGDTDALSKTVRLDNKLELTVGGVYEDLPDNTTFNFTKILLPWDNEENWLNRQTSWDNHCGQLFVQLNDHIDVDKTSAKIRSVPTPHIKEWKEEIMLQPMSKLHLYSGFANDTNPAGRIVFVWLFGTIGVFVLLLACINFMNLSTARSEKRAKEVGIRKTVGSRRWQLIGQFLSESVMVAMLAFGLSLIMIELSLSFFNELANKQISIPWQNSVFWLLAGGFTLFTGIISGSYPAFYLSAFNPVKVLKGAIKAGRAAMMPRKVLVVLQFTISAALIIGTIVVFRQIQFAKDRPAGYSRDGLISVWINTPDLQGHYDAIRNDLLQTGAVKNMAESSQSASHFGNNTGLEWKGKDPDLITFFRNVTVTPDFGNTIGWTIKEGRDFSRDIPSDSNAIILNEKAAAIMGFENPIGETVEWGKGEVFHIIGVTNDMITQSPFEPTEQTFFTMRGWLGVITIRLSPEVPVREALAKIEPVFKKYDPGSPFQYRFVDEEFAWKYQNEERIGNLSSLFAILAIFISCLGLFGLSSFMAEQRTKEIGIRKVLGASVIHLWKMLSGDFVVLAVISLLIATPLTYYVMNSWLQNYQYRSELSWWIFGSAGAGLIIITLLTVSFQAVRSAVANPVKSLRSE